MRLKLLIFVVGLLLTPGWIFLQAQDVIRASGGTDISIDSVTTGGYVTLDGPSIRENSAAELTSGGTVVLTLPDGYEWNTGLTGDDIQIEVIARGANKTSLEASFSSINSTEVVINIDSESKSAGNGQGPGRIDITGLQLRPTNTNVPDEATIANTGTTGPDANYGELSKAPGSVAEVRVETEVDGSGNIVQTQDILAGNSITVYAIARDIGGNFIENIALEEEGDWNLTNTTGNISGGAIEPADNLQSASFSSQQTGTANIEAFHNNVTVTPSETITVLPRTADELAIGTQPSATATAGEAFDTQPVLQLLDQFGNLVTTNSESEVTVHIESGDGTLSGSLTEQADEGEISFTDLSANIANTISLEFESPGLSAVTSDDIEISPNDPVNLEFIQEPTNTAQNRTIEPPVEVQLLDDYDNEVPESGIDITVSDEGYFKNSSSLTASTNSEGKAVFDDLNISNGPPIGEATFDIDFNGIDAPLTGTFNIISANDLAGFTIVTPDGNDLSDQEAGVSFPIQIQALDGNNDIFDNFEDTVQITADADILSNGNQVSSFTSNDFTDGVLDTTITLTSSGSTRIYAENNDLDREGRSNEFTVTSTDYDLNESTLTAEPSEITADGNSTTTITLQLADTYGNKVTSGGETVEFITTEGTFSNGNTTMTATDEEDGTYTAELTSSNNSDLDATVTAEVNNTLVPDDVTVDFVPGGVDGFVISLPQNNGTPETQTAGEAFSIDITAVDAAGNQVNDFDDDVTISTTSEINSGSSLTLAGGEVTGHSLTLTESREDVTLTVTADNLFDVSSESESFEVVAGPPSASGSNVVASPSVLLSDPEYESTITVILRDEFGNRILSEETINFELEQLEENDNASSGTPDASLSSITYNTDQSTYTATLTASSTVELIEITALFDGGSEIDEKPTLDIVLPKVWEPGNGPADVQIDWNREENWNPEGVPESDDFVVIPSGTEPPEVDLNVILGSLEVQDGVTLVLFGGNAIEVAGNLEIEGTLDIEDNTDIISGGNFIGSGTFTAGDETTIEIAGDIFINSFFARTTGSVITLNGSSPQTIASPNFLAQNMQIENDVTVKSGGDLIDAGLINIVAGQTFELEDGAGLTIDIENEITGDGSFVLNDNTFVLRGNAEFGNVDVSEGTVIFGIRLDENFEDFPDLEQQQVGDLSEMKNAVINNTEGVRTYEDITINGDLTLENGPLVIGSGKSLIAPNITYNNGILRMRRGIGSEPGWRMLAPPVASTYNNFLENTDTQGYPNSSLGDAPEDSLQPNVLWYDESYEGTDNQRWRAPSDADTALTAGRGLFVYFFGDIDGDSRYNTSLPLTLEIDGEEFVDDGTSFQFPVSYTAEADSGWNLVGNPFAASIDWDHTGWTKTNMDNVLYIWDPDNNDYLYWNGVSGGDLDGDELNDGTITPFQAFWVKANAEEPLLSLNTEAKTTGGEFRGKDHRNPASMGFLLEAGGMRKSMHITFSNDGKTGKDERDAYRLLPFETNSYLEMYSTLKDGTQLAINNLSRDFGTELEIPVHLGGFEDGKPLNESATLSWPEFGDIPDDWEITLQDREKDETINLRKQEEYSFNLNSSRQKLISNTVQNFSTTPRPSTKKKISNDHKPRFILRINPGEDADGLPDKYELFENYPNPFNPSTTIRFALPVEGKIKLTVYDILGRKVATLTDRNYEAGFHEIQWDASSHSSGVYLYRLVTDEATFTKKMTLIK